MWRDALLVIGKDLRIEARSRVALNQVIPFAAAVVLLFGLALGPSRAVLEPASAGLFWVAVLLSTILATQRSFAVESRDGNKDGLRLSGLDPAGIFLGKAAAVAVQLIVLEALLTAGVMLLFGSSVHSVPALVVASVLGTAGLAAVGVLYGALSAGLRVRETLLPLLLLPVVAPVLLAGTREWQVALHTAPSAGANPWMALLVVFAAVYLALGVVIFGPIQEAA